MSKALLIVGHGSKSEDVVIIFDKIINHIKQKAVYDYVYGAHLEFAKPGIEEAVDEITKKTVSEIIIVPYFLYEGNHIKFDIPEIIGRLKKDHPEINFIIGKPIGFEPALADILLKRATEAEKNMNDR